MAEECQRKLRIGLLLNSETVAAWQYLAIRRIIESDAAEIVLVAINGLIGRSEPLPLAYRLYRHFDRKVLKAAPDAFARVPLSDLLPGVERVQVLPRQTKFSDYFPSETCEMIRSRNLDVLIRFGFRILRGEILHIPRLGVWSYHHGDPERYRGGPPGFWEVMEGAPETGCILQVLTEDLDNGPVLYRSFSLTDKLSVNRNKNRLYWKSASFIARVLREVQRLGPERFLAKIRPQQDALTFYSRPMYTQNTLGWLSMMRLLVALAWRNGKRKFADALWREQWFLLYRLGSGVSTSFWRFRRLLPPLDRFWADPHVLCRDGRYYIFWEELPYRTGKGRIVCARLNEQGETEMPVPVLERDYHLSHPFVFEYAGEVYMLPETQKNRTVELYRATEFPYRWELDRYLLEDISAVDGTLLHHDGRWWLFANAVENPGACSFDELFLYSTDDLLKGVWEPHPLNPIVSNVRCARPAGRIFEHYGKLYRPAQNCAGRYGSGIVLHRIDKLSRTDYVETSVTRFDAKFATEIDSMHTFNCSGDLTVADARIRRWKSLRGWK